MATSDETKQCWAFCLAAAVIVWAISWGIVAYNRAFLDAGYSEVVVPGKQGTVWQKQPQAERLKL